jgi:hypothetical protein
LVVVKQQNYDEAKRQCEWEMAMEADYDMFMRNDTWVLQELLVRKKPVVVNGFKINCNADGLLDRQKAMLVGGGFA